jgi:hypothetical protein
MLRTRGAAIPRPCPNRGPAQVEAGYGELLVRGQAGMPVPLDSQECLSH